MKPIAVVLLILSFAGIASAQLGPDQRVIAKQRPLWKEPLLEKPQPESLCLAGKIARIAVLPDGSPQIECVADDRLPATEVARIEESKYRVADKKFWFNAALEAALTIAHVEVKMHSPCRRVGTCSDILLGHNPSRAALYGTLGPLTAFDIFAGYKLKQWGQQDANNGHPEGRNDWWIAPIAHYVGNGIGMGLSIANRNTGVKSFEAAQNVCFGLHPPKGLCATR